MLIGAIVAGMLWGSPTTSHMNARTIHKKANIPGTVEVVKSQTTIRESLFMFYQMDICLI